MCYSNDPRMEKEKEDEEPTLNEIELDLLEEMENRRTQFLSDLQKSFDKILEAKQKFLWKPAENVAKVKWDVVIEFSKELHQAALIWIELKLFELPMIEHAPKFFSLLSKLLKLANGAIVGTERSLRKCICESVEAVLQDGLNLIAGAATPSESDDERRGKTVKLVASFLDALADLKKAPTNNLAAIELQLMKVTGELYDVLTEWKEPKKASSDLAAHVEMKIGQLNDGAILAEISKLIRDKSSKVLTDMTMDFERYESSKKEASFDIADMKKKVDQLSNNLSLAILAEINKLIRAPPDTNYHLNKMEKALADMNENVNVKNATRLVCEYLNQMLCIIHHFLMKKDEEGVIVIFEKMLHLCQSITSRAKKALAHKQDGAALYVLFDEAHKAMAEVVLFLDDLDI